MQNSALRSIKKKFQAQKKNKKNVKSGINNTIMKLNRILLKPYKKIEFIEIKSKVLTKSKAHN